MGDIRRMKNMKELQLIIFDMDGLMFDTERIAFISWKIAASDYGYEVDEEIFKKTVGVNLKGTTEIFLKYFGKDFPIESIINERFKRAEDLIKLNGVPVKNGLYDLLEYLNEINIKKAVATSTSRERAATLLKMAGIEKCFDYVICGDEIKYSKPDPEIFLKVAEKLDCLPENCLVLEDSDVGIEAASRAGMLPVMIPDMKEPEDSIKRLTYKIFDTLHEVKTWMECGTL
jgi:HAD superfamily hydrolase (TIGR01509 family)